MDWKKEAADKLRDLELKREALRNIPMEKERVRSCMEGIRSAGVDGDPVKGSTNRREERLLGCIVKLDELERQETQARLWVEMVSGALEQLGKEERLVLDRLYICPLKGNVDRLCEELALERASVYRRRDQALRRFTLAMYGGVES